MLSNGSLRKEKDKEKTAFRQDKAESVRDTAASVKD